MTTAIRSLDFLASEAAAALKPMLRDAYNLGREDMKREMMRMLSPQEDDSTSATPPPAARSASGKLMPGTVKPAILELVENSEGLLTEQIISKTGFKENSVRGTLSALLKEGKIARLNGYWVKKAEASLFENKEAP